MVVIPPLSEVIQPLEPLYRVTMPNLPIYCTEIRGRRGEAVGTEAGAPPNSFHVACVPAAGEAGARVETRDITEIKYSYPWAPRPVPLQIHSMLYLYLRPMTIAEGRVIPE